MASGKRVYDMASASSINSAIYSKPFENPMQPFYDSASAASDVDVLAATTNSAGVSAVYSIPLDTGNDFATYDRARAGESRKRTAPNAARARTTTLGWGSTATLPQSGLSANAARARKATLGWGIAVKAVEGKYQNQVMVDALSNTPNSEVQSNTSVRIVLKDPSRTSGGYGFGTAALNTVNNKGRASVYHGFEDQDEDV